MKTKILALYSSLLLISLAGLQCATDPVSTGNTKQSMIKGTVRDINGNAVNGATILIQDKKHLADVSGSLGKKASGVTNIILTTDQNGNYSLESIVPGNYVVEGKDASRNVGLNSSVKVESYESSVTVPVVTLKPAGAIKGIIKLSGVDDPRKVFLLAFGVDKYARVNSDGTFKFTGLAEGNYDLRVLPLLDNYSVVDTNNIAVASGDTTDLGILSVPYIGLPKVSGVTTAAGLLGAVTVIWNKPKTGGNVYGYNIYKKEIDSLSYTVIKKGIIDTSFIDTLSPYGCTNSYKIVAIDSNYTEGEKSDAVTTSVSPHFQIDTIYTNALYQQKDGITQASILYVNGTGEIYYTNSTFNGICVADDKMTEKLKFNYIDGRKPTKLAINSEGTMFIASEPIIPEYVAQKRAVIHVVNSSGVLIDSITEVSSDSAHTVVIKDFFILNNSLFALVSSSKFNVTTTSNSTNNTYSDTTTSVKVMDFKGNVKKSWLVQDAQSIEPVSSSGMAIQRTRSIDYYDLTGIFKTSISIEWADWWNEKHPCGDADFYIDSKGRIILEGNFYFMLFNTSGTMISKYDLYNTKYWQAGATGEPQLYSVSDFNSKKDIVYLSTGNMIVKIINTIQ